MKGRKRGGERQGRGERGEGRRRGGERQGRGEGGEGRGREVGEGREEKSDGADWDM